MKKKIFSILVTILLMMGVSTPVLADEIYVPSIGVRTDIEIYGGEIEPETGVSVLWDWCDGCHRKIVVTPYYLKETIESDKSRSDIDIAYQMIMEAEHVSDLNSGVIPVANAKGATDDDLFIRDVFDITTYYCPLQGNTIEITLTTEELSRYICLLHYVDGEFEIVPEAYVVIDDCHLYLRVDKLSPFAVVLASDYSYAPVSPAEDDGCIWHWYMIITLIITLIIDQLVHITDDDKAKVVRIKRWVRDIVSAINLILCIVFFMHGSCILDVYAMIADVVGLVIVLIYTHNNNHEYYQKKQRSLERQQQQ